MDDDNMNSEIIRDGVLVFNEHTMNEDHSPIASNEDGKDNEHNPLHSLIPTVPPPPSVSSDECVSVMIIDNDSEENDIESKEKKVEMQNIRDDSPKRRMDEVADRYNDNDPYSEINSKLDRVEKNLRRGIEVSEYNSHELQNVHGLADDMQDDSELFANLNKTMEHKMKTNALRMKVLITIVTLLVIIGSTVLLVYLFGGFKSKSQSSSK